MNQRILRTLALLVGSALLAASCQSTHSTRHPIPLKVAIAPLAYESGRATATPADGPQSAEAGLPSELQSVRYQVLSDEHFLEDQEVDPAQAEQFLPYVGKDALRLRVDDSEFCNRLLDELTRQLHGTRFTSVVLLQYPDETVVPRKDFLALDAIDQQRYWFQAARANKADAILWPTLTVSPVVGRKWNDSTVVGTIAWLAIGPFALPVLFDDQTYYVSAELQADMHDLGILEWLDQRNRLGTDDKVRGFQMDQSSRIAQFSVDVDRVELDMIDRKGWDTASLASLLVIPPAVVGRGSDRTEEVLRDRLVGALTSKMSERIAQRAQVILDDDGVPACKLVGVRTYDDPILYRDEVAGVDALVMQGLVLPTRYSVAPEDQPGNLVRVMPAAVVRDDGFSIEVLGRSVGDESWRPRLAPASAYRLRDDEKTRSQVELASYRGKARGTLFEPGTGAQVINQWVPYPSEQEINASPEPTVRVTIGTQDFSRSYTFALPDHAMPPATFHTVDATPEDQAVIEFLKKRCADRKGPQ